MTSRDKVYAEISRKSGLTTEEIKKKSPEKLREHLTKKTGKPFSVTSLFPWIGRGNVLRDGIIDSTKLNKQIDALLGVK